MSNSVATPQSNPDFSDEKVEMQFVLIVHEVESYSAWKIVFDRASGIRKAAGEISYQLLRYDNEQNTIVHFLQWSSLKNARNFFESRALQAIRREAGVIAPNFIYLNEIEQDPIALSLRSILCTKVAVYAEQLNTKLMANLDPSCIATARAAERPMVLHFRQYRRSPLLIFT